MQSLAEKLTEQDRRLIQACAVANRDSEVAEIGDEFSALPDEVTESWSDARRGEASCVRLDPGCVNRVTRTR